MQAIAHSLSAWATALGIDRGTLERRLVKAGFSLKKDGGKVVAKQVFLAMVGDGGKSRLVEAQALKVELQNSLANGTVQTREGVERELWEMGLSKVREEWLGYERTTGVKLRSILESAGVSSEVIGLVVAAAVAGVTSPMEKLAKVCRPGVTPP